jgi:hypothetical protein
MSALPDVLAPQNNVRLIQGYIDEISISQVSGWIRDGLDATNRIPFLAVLGGASPEILGAGVANAYYAPLGNGAFGDGHYGFALALPRPLSSSERARLEILPGYSATPLERANAHQGFVDERSISHVAGWVRDRYDPEARVPYEVVLTGPEGERILSEGIADRPHGPLTHQGLGDGRYGFWVILAEPLTEEDRERVIVRPKGGAALPLSPALVTSFELLSFIAMDIVNNCNLRCPFCLYDYEGVKHTRFISEDVFDSALRLIPHAKDGGFWLSCLHEPTLNPKLIELIERIPRQWRRKVMFTTNLAKRMPESYFKSLAESGVHNINISVESTNPPVYEKFRKGARWPIFKENWDRLVTAWQAAEAPPKLRYIALAYKSNLHELRGLVEYLLNERCAWQVEVRYTLDMDHIGSAFSQAEYLDTAEWDWLEAELSGFAPERLIFTRPLPPLEGALAPTPASPRITAELDENAPEMAAPTQAQLAEQAAKIIARWQGMPQLPLNLTLEWDGTAVICAHWDHPDDRACLSVINIKAIESPYDYLVNLAAKPLSNPMVQGYIDEITSRHVSGWLRDAMRPDEHLHIEVVITGSHEDVVIAQAIAGEVCPALANAAFSDHDHGFTVPLPESLTQIERETLIVRDARSWTNARRAPRYQGFIDRLGLGRVEGWVRNRFAPDERVEVEAVLESGANREVLATGIATSFRTDLADGRAGDALYGFELTFNRRLSPEERRKLIVLPKGSASALEHSPRLILDEV